MSRGRRLGNRNWVTDLGTVLYQQDFAEVPVVLSGRFAARRRARDIIPRTSGGEAIILVRTKVPPPCRIRALRTLARRYATRLEKAPLVLSGRFVVRRRVRDIIFAELKQRVLGR